MANKIKIIGEKYSMLTVLCEVERDKHGRFFECLCDCGKKSIVSLNHLRSAHTKSCGCQKNRGGGRKPLPNNGGKISLLLSNYRTKAKKKNLKFELTKSEFSSLIKQNCYYCGCVPSQIIKSYCELKYKDEEERKNLEYNGIDRINSSRGYSIDNCVPCCKYCNFAKNDLTEEQFYLHILRIVDNKKLSHNMAVVKNA